MHEKGGCLVPLTIHTDLCVCCGMCAERLPAVFRIDRAARSAEVVRQPQPTETDDALEAAEDCPVGAIIWTQTVPTA